MSQSPVVTGLVLGTSLFAATFAALAWSRGPSAGEAASLRRLEESVGALGESIGRAVASISALALEVDRLAEPTPRQEAAGDDPPTAAAGGEGDGGHETIRTALERLEGIAARLERASAAGATPLIVTAAAPETAEDRKRIVEESQPVALDRQRSPDERLKALRELRSRDGRSREVALAMLELIESPDLDPRTRADIIRNLDGVDFPELKDPLLRILANDTHPETRSETVETLQPFYGDGAVHAAVANVRDNDQDLRVRMEALERLMQYEILKERLEKAGGR